MSRTLLAGSATSASTMAPAHCPSASALPPMLALPTCATLAANASHCAHWLTVHDAHCARTPPSQARQYAVPPGGHGSFEFDDRVSRMNLNGGDALSRRHTNGVLRKSSSVADVGSPYRNPPGGRSNINLLADGSSPESVGFGDQARLQSNPAIGTRRHCGQPAGGFSQFSVGWGGEKNGNHHHDYLSRVAPMPPMPPLDNMPPAGRRNVLHLPAEPQDCHGYEAQSGNAAASARSFAPPQQQQLPERHQPHSDFSTAFALACPGPGLPPPHTTTRVRNPPGGASTFLFG